MAVKYSIEYLDVLGREFVCEISNDSYTGEPIILEGRCTIVAARVTDHFTPIRGKSMRIDVKATSQRTLGDLWKEDTFYWKTVLKSGPRTLFVGFLTNEGVFEDYNTDVWELSLEATGILGILNDLAYVKPNGNPYVGNETMIQIVSNSIRRAFPSGDPGMEIMAYSDIRHNNQPLFEVAHIDQSIYLSENGENYASCFEVIEGICLSTGCIIVQEFGRMYILPPHFLAQTTELKFSLFEPDGRHRGVRLVERLAQYVGNQGYVKFDKKTAFHCSANQQITRVKPVSVLSLRNDHVFDAEIIPNNELLFPDGRPGRLSNSWLGYGDENDAEFLQKGIKIYGRQNRLTEFGNVPDVVVILSPRVTVAQGFTPTVYFRVTGYPQTDYYKLRIQLRLTVGLKSYYPKSDGTWIDSVLGSVPSGPFNYEQDGRLVEFKAGPVPFEGTLSVQVRSPLYDNNPTTKFVVLEELGILNQVELDTEATESIYRSSNQRGSVPEIQEIPFNTGTTLNRKDILSDVNERKIPYIDSISTGFFQRSLLHYVTLNRAKIQRTGSLVFAGNVFGSPDFINNYLPLMGIYSYEGISERMFPLEWEYDTAANIYYLKCVELNYNASLTLTIKENTVFKNTIKPTIE